MTCFACGCFRLPLDASHGLDGIAFNNVHVQCRDGSVAYVHLHGRHCKDSPVTYVHFLLQVYLWMICLLHGQVLYTFALHQSLMALGKSRNPGSSNASFPKKYQLFSNIRCY